MLTLAIIPLTFDMRRIWWKFKLRWVASGEWVRKAHGSAVHKKGKQWIISTETWKLCACKFGRSHEEITCFTNFCSWKSCLNFSVSGYFCLCLQHTKLGWRFLLETARPKLPLHACSHGSRDDEPLASCGYFWFGMSYSLILMSLLRFIMDLLCLSQYDNTTWYFGCC